MSLGRSRQKLEEAPQVQLHGNWSSFQLAISTSPLGVIDNAIAPPARMTEAGGLLTSICVHGARMSLLSPLLSLIRVLSSETTQKNWVSRINASCARHPLVKGERMVRCVPNAAMMKPGLGGLTHIRRMCADVVAQGTRLPKRVRSCSGGAKLQQRASSQVQAP